MLRGGYEGNVFEIQVSNGLFLATRLIRTEIAVDSTGGLVRRPVTPADAVSPSRQNLSSSQISAAGMTPRDELSNPRYFPKITSPVYEVLIQRTTLHHVHYSS